MGFLYKRRSNTISYTTSPYLQTTERSRRMSAVSAAGAECSTSSDDDSLKRQSPVLSSINSEMKWFFLDIADGFKRKEVSVVEGEDGELVKLSDTTTPFSVRELRKDIGRLLLAAKPFREAGAALGDYFMWTNPLASLMLTIVYMYCIWIGVIWALIFGLLMLQMGLNYLKAVHNIDIGINFLPRKEVSAPKVAKSSGQLLIDVAKAAHGAVRFLADVLEKLESMFTWKRPSISFHFTLLLFYWFMWSTCFSIGTCFGACGMTFGIRLFITAYLFKKFPRLRYRLDTYGYFYRNLPVKSGVIPAPPYSTDARSFPSTLAKRSYNESNLSIPSTEAHRSLEAMNFSPTRSMISEIEEFDSVESLEEEDELIDDAIDFRRCTMTEKGSAKVNISGTLHLTPQALVFQSHSGEEVRMLVMEDIAAVRKVNSAFSLFQMSESRKGLEVESVHGDMTTFTGMHKRREFVEAMRRRASTRTQFYLA